MGVFNVQMILRDARQALILLRYFVLFDVKVALSNICNVRQGCSILHLLASLCIEHLLLMIPLNLRKFSILNSLLERLDLLVDVLVIQSEYTIAINLAELLRAVNFSLGLSQFITFPCNYLPLEQG